MNQNKINLLKSLLSSEFAYDQQNVYSNYSGVASPRLFEQGQFFSDQTFIAQQYLLNFENSYKMGPILGTGEYMANASNVALLYENIYNEEIENIIKLPKPRKIKVRLDTALQNRCSSHYFDGSTISIQDLSDFLYYSAGSTQKKTEKIAGQSITRYKRTYPSGGGMYCIRIYLCIYNVEKIIPGIYVYQPVSHTIVRVGNIVDLDEFIVTKRYNNITGEYQTIKNQNPSVFIINVNNFTKQRMKYSELSLLLALTDNGCLMQNFGLLASALNLHYCVWAGFKKTNIEQILKIDGLNEHVIMTSLLGGKI